VADDLINQKQIADLIGCSFGQLKTAISKLPQFPSPVISGGRKTWLYNKKHIDVWNKKYGAATVRECASRKRKTERNDTASAFNNALAQLFIRGRYQPNRRGKT
jgi:hypothetical protein